MKTFSILIFTVSFLATSAFAQTDRDKISHGAFDRVVSALKTDDAKTIVRTGPGGIKVTCMVLPHGELTAVAWEVYNPESKSLDIEQSDVKLFDQVRELETMIPEKAAGVLYGTEYTKNISDPFIDEASPAAYDSPAIASASQGTKDVYASAFNFGKTSSPRIMGIVYYSRYGVGESLTATINLAGNKFKFEF